jgi:hypothetical protein
VAVYKYTIVGIRPFSCKSPVKVEFTHNMSLILVKKHGILIKFASIFPSILISDLDFQKIYNVSRVKTEELIYWLRTVRTVTMDA